MPATMMLRTSPYAGGMLAFVAIAHASRICFGSSLIRPSMFSGSAARIRSTDSITDVSRFSVFGITFPLNQALILIQEPCVLALSFRFVVHPVERLAARLPDQ